MRIAACFAGQPRFINECAPSILQNVFKDQQVDVFAHLWFCDELHNETFKYGGDGGWEGYRIPKTAVDDFIRHYKPVDIKAEPSVHFYDPYMEEGFDIPLNKYWGGGNNEPDYMPRQIDRTLSNFYSQSEACKLKSLYEYNNKFKYDWVFKFRPDVQIHNQINLEDYSPHAFNCMAHTCGFDSHINDWFGFGGSDIMDVFMGVFPMFQRIFDLTKYNNEGAWDNETLHARSTPNGYRDTETSLCSYCTKVMKIVIWGHPLHSHTHSYVHQGYYDGFKSLGHEVYWFHDDDYPEDFDFTNTLFIGEGFADKKIPINDSSTYFIMYLPDPRKYDGAKRLVDVKLTATNFKDHIIEWSFDESKCQSMGPSVWFEPKTNELIKLKNDYIDVEIPDYDKMYISWASNLLPEQINFDDMYMERENAIYFCGTISPHGVCENWSNWEPFIQQCSENGIDFHCNDVWSNPLSFDEVQKQAQKSILGVDIRSKEHVRQRLVTCRVFKNISYGHLGMTNSEQIYQEMDGNCIYNEDPAALFHEGMANRENYDMIRKGMQYVKENHTYINRCSSVLKIFEEGE